MNKKLIIKDYNKKIKLIKFYNQKYYEDNTSEINDKEYDELKSKILLLENKYDFLKSKDSPSISVGHKPSRYFKKVAHKVPMLSLSNAFSEGDLKNFEKKNFKFFR